jgi:UDP-N-acetylglucosamine--N-acetylmuramyl-(pentapeptide) pyrophosphoryl-undecaprenol N-acetylglucosamine transferase
MQPIRIIIAGGGTGGHIFPAVAIGHALQRMAPGTELLFVGANGKMEMEKVPQEGFRIVGLDIAGMNRSSMLKNLSLPFKLIKSLWDARGILKSFRPQVVVGVGGYASYPVLRMAQAMGIPTVIQEQNSYAGKSNKDLGRRAKAICVAYEGMQVFFPEQAIHITGNPVRQLITQATITHEAACAHFSLDPNQKTVLVIGGSLGARSINEAIGAALPALMSKGLQVLWQTGKGHLPEAETAARSYPGRVVVKEFIREMDTAYAAADLVVSRAGALAIAELCIVAKPVIFVPYPHAAEDHQTSNAQALVEKGAARMIPDAQARQELLPELLNLLQDTATQQTMRRALTAMAIRNADERIAGQILAFVSPSKTQQP